tara:strand:- start:424 stop:741 length:318 start_codon:yes stop_codon:yes gene_type:complete
MTFYYQTSSWSSQPQVTDETIQLWKHIVQKKNWRIVQLPNGFYQTEYKDPDCECNPEKDTCCEKWIDVTRRETIEGAEQAIDASINHYEKKLAYIRGPQVVKTFK